MNILPKKRWHVRTKENIARVRKDEAEAAEKEKQERLRIENADREARLTVLKNKSKEKLSASGIVDNTKTYTKDLVQKNEHINLFYNPECAVTSHNKEHDDEVKAKKEEYEKKIGYLTYLGQDTNEALGKKNWYETLPHASRSDDIRCTYDKLILKDEDGQAKIRESDTKDGEIAWKAKQLLDPINSFKSYCSDHKTKQNQTVDRKTHGKIKSKYHEKNHQKKVDLQSLRLARLKREQQERSRTQDFLSGLNGSTQKTVTSESRSPKLKPKYNSQFNPELARQNFK